MQSSKPTSRISAATTVFDTPSTAAAQQQAAMATVTAPAGTKPAVTPEQRQKIISDSIRGIPDFPKPGILFWDVTTLMLNPTAFQLTIDALYDRYKDQKVDVVAGELCRCASCWHQQMHSTWGQVGFTETVILSSGAAQ